LFIFQQCFVTSGPPLLETVYSTLGLSAYVDGKSRRDTPRIKEGVRSAHLFGTWPWCMSEFHPQPTTHTHMCRHKYTELYLFAQYVNVHICVLSILQQPTEILQSKAKLCENLKIIVGTVNKAGRP